MLIILEGMDLTGKSTLANILSEKLGYPIVKGSSFEQAQCSNEELFESFLELTTLRNTILDRFIYSNEVYASVYKDFAILSDEQRRFIEREIKGDVLVIYLHARNDILVERMKIRGDDYVTTDKFAEIKSKYLKAISKIKNIEGMHFDTGQQSTEEIAESILLKVNN